MSRLAGALLALAAIVHVVLGVSAIAGTPRLEANVREIETSAVGGELYFALGTIGLIMALIGALELVAMGVLYARGERARIFGMIASFLAMGVVFWTMPIFRWASVATILPLFAVAYLLAYHVGEPE